MSYFKNWTMQDVERFNKKTPPNKQPEMVKIVISGQVRGGKNNMIVTRTGLHFPKKEWAKWRDEKVSEVKAQLPGCYKHNGDRINLRLDYYAGDNRRRDMPAIIDSIFHVLEKAGFVNDDTNLWIVESSRGYDKENPRAVLTIISHNETL